jgi:cell wall-associated NlpC family hydrolase
LLVSLSGSAVAAALVLAPSIASADPAPQTVAQAKAQVEKLQQQAEAADQDYLGLKEKLDHSQADLKNKQADLADQSKKVARMREQISRVALAQFQNRSLDTRTRLFLTRDTSGFLNQMATVEKVAENQNSALQSYQVEQANLADMQRSIQAEIATLKADKKQLGQLRSQADEKVQQAQQVLDRLTAEQRQAIAAEQQRQAQAAQRDADAAATATGATTNDNSTSSTNNTEAATSTADGGAASVPASGKGAQVVAFAKAQLGKPYVFGATGPGSYDCSGLTMAAWKSVGVQLDRTSEAQFHDGVPVSQSDLQPGDLVFFYGSAPSHVGIYVGNGTIIHAPRPGRGVEYTKLSYMPFSGARRPG